MIIRLFLFLFLFMIIIIIIIIINIIHFYTGDLGASAKACRLTFTDSNASRCSLLLRDFHCRIGLVLYWSPS